VDSVDSSRGIFSIRSLKNSCQTYVDGLYANFNILVDFKRERFACAEFGVNDDQSKFPA